MDPGSVLEKAENFARGKLKNDPTGHDWWHIERVRKMAVRLAKQENADRFVVELACILHDIPDWKLYGEAGQKMIRNFLKENGIGESAAAHICDIIDKVSYKGAGVKNDIKTIEGMVVQDADRLDAMGAIGIARCFSTGAKLGRVIYDPHAKPEFHDSFEKYKASGATSINHFYEKLLLLKDMMNTEAARKIAQSRHDFMKMFLDEFLQECGGEK